MIATLWWLCILVRANAVAPWGDERVPEDRQFEMGLAMVLASSDEVSEYEIKRIVEHESGYWVDARPHYKHWPDDPSKFPHRKKYICGLMQATAHSPEECVAWQRDVFLALRAGADTMRDWHNHCRRIGRRGSKRYKCARAGYKKGTEAARLSS